MINESCRGSTRSRIASPEHRCCNWGVCSNVPMAVGNPRGTHAQRTLASRRRAIHCEGLHHVPEAVIRQGRASPPTTRQVVGSLRVLSAMRLTRPRRYTNQPASVGRVLAAEWVHQSCGPGQILNKASPATCSSTKALITRTLMLAEAAARPSRQVQLW